jgi:hypothetical protein
MLSVVVLLFFFAKEALRHPLKKEVFDISSEVAAAILDWQASRGPLSPSCDPFIISC